MGAPSCYCQLEYCPLHAAAPDMYEALKAALYDLKTVAVHTTSRVQVEAAIAKAEGQEVSA